MIFTVISIIKSIGYGSILYISAITSVDQDMYEAAYIDGRRTVSENHILRCRPLWNYRNHADFQISNILNTGFEQVLILQNSPEHQRQRNDRHLCIQNRMTQQRYSYATAVGLFKIHNCSCPVMVCE